MKEHFLTILRDRNTDSTRFRSATNHLSSLIAAEISAKIKLEKESVQTPLAAATGARLAQNIVLVPILRAGLTLLPAFQSLFENARIGFFGIRRDEKTAHPHLYYEKLPPLSPADHILLLDPMLATGGTANLALDRLKEKGASLPHSTLVTIVASKEGLGAIQIRHPEISVYSVSVDPKLSPDKFIVPGVGDFGDRYFGN